MEAGACCAEGAPASLKVSHALREPCVSLGVAWAKQLDGWMRSKGMQNITHRFLLRSTAEQNRLVDSSSGMGWCVASRAGRQ